MRKNKKPEAATGNEVGGKGRFSLAIRFAVFLPEAGTAISPVTGDNDRVFFWDKNGRQIKATFGLDQPASVVPSWSEGYGFKAELRPGMNEGHKEELGLEGIVQEVRLQVPEKPPHGMTFKGVPVGTKIQTLYGKGFVYFAPVSVISLLVRSGHLEVSSFFFDLELLFRQKGMPVGLELKFLPLERWVEYLMWYAGKAGERDNLLQLKRIGLNPSLQREARFDAIKKACEATMPAEDIGD